MDYKYTGDIEQKWKLLLPIPKTARLNEPYKGHCKMGEDRLVIRSRTYTLENLYQLPDDLNCFKVTSKESDNYLDFFDGLNPLSNFHIAPFTVDGIEYISSEQFIQAKKVEYFNNGSAYDRIMGSSNILDCKKNSRFIKGFDNSKWGDIAKHICSPGIKAKFQQNAELMSILLNKTGYKTVVECTNDRLWGTGIPLNKSECLDRSKWTVQGILGEILEEIHLESRPTMTTLPPPGFTGAHTCFNNVAPLTGITLPVSCQMLFNPTARNTPCQAPLVQAPITSVGYVPNTTNLPHLNSTMVPQSSVSNHPKPANNTKHPVVPKTLRNNVLPKQ